jgi:diguanylate cyclase (GGDEF)-like protein
LAWCGLAVLSLVVPRCVSQQFSFSDTNDGLGNLNVNCIAQDRSGYLWVGTENGLYRYDGNRFQQFGSSDGLAEHAIQSLFLGLDGTLWVGTTSSIYFHLPNGKFAPVSPPAPFNQFSHRIGTVFTAVSGNEVITADRSGAFLLRHVEPERWAAEAMHLEGKAIWSLQYEPEPAKGPGHTGHGGVLWYGCDLDLCRLAGGKTTHMAAALHLPDGPWHHMLLAHDGHLWMRGAAHVGELIYAENRFALHDLPGTATNVPYAALVEDAKGQIVGSQGPSLGLWENAQWRMVTAANGLTRNDISALFADREGSIWIGEVGHGLKRWVGQDRWEGYTVADGLSDDIIWSTLRDRTGRLWVGTESGLDSIAAGKHTATAWHGAGIQTARAVSLAESADGAIWMGSAAGSLARIDPKTLAGTQWKVPEVYRILPEGDHIWVATGAGLFVVNAVAGDRTPRLVEDKAIADPGKRFTDLSLDNEKRLWAASDGGLFRLDGSGWRRIDAGLSAVNPFHVAADHEGNLWATGAFAGLMRLRVVGDRIVESEHIPRAHLLSDQVIALLVDHRGWVWVGQDAGLTEYDGHQWRSLTQDDGLVWNDLDAYALAEDPDGGLWIGTSGGLAHLLSPQDSFTGAPQAPVISQVAFGSKVIAEGDRVEWNTEPLTVSIASLSFRGTRHVHFRYRLEGLETEWVDTGDRTVRYAHLDPGSYRFELETVDESGELVSPVSAIAFRITPRWWQSVLLRLALALLAGVCVVLVWRARIQHLLNQRGQLENAVKTRTVDLEREKAELLRTHEKMRQYAERDDLTGLWNHRIIMERLRQEVDRSQRDRTPLTVILVDLDHFKNVNDTFGHPAGDRVLKEISDIFQRAVRNYDWVGRYGGEEFMIILPGASFVGARLRAEQMRMSVQAARVVDGEIVMQVTASFGVASGFPSDHEAVIQVADAALYRAKKNGRNCVMATEIETQGSGGLTAK